MNLLKVEVPEMSCKWGCPRENLCLRQELIK